MKEKMKEEYKISVITYENGKREVKITENEETKIYSKN
jgi:hypothetical protein